MVLDPESVKKIDNLTVIFTNLGSVRVKGAYKTLMKFSPVLIRNNDSSKQHEKCFCSFDLYFNLGTSCDELLDKKNS